MVRTHHRSLARVGKGLAIAFVALAGTRADAQTFNWNNFAGTAGGGTLTWTDIANWNAPPTFDQNAILSFASSNFQVAPWYVANSDLLTANVNGLLFNFEGGSQASFVSGGAPYLINLGDTATSSGLHMNPSSSAVAPSITQNGAGAVAIRANVGPSSMILEGALPVQIGGTGIGSVEIASKIEMGATPAVPSGFVINFNPSAVRSNNSGATVTFSGINAAISAGVDNTFLGDVVLQNGNLNIGGSRALGQTTNQLIINPGANSVRVTNIVGAPTIANPVVLNSSMNFVSYDGSASTWTGAWSGAGGLNIRPAIGMTFNMFGTGGFAGPLVLQSQLLGYSGTANDLVFNLGSSVGGATTGTLATTDLQLFAGSRMVVTNANANATRLAAGTNLTMYRSSFGLTANATAGNNAAETLASLTNTGMSTIIATPQTATSSTLTFGSWTRNSNSTAYFVGTGLGGTPGANVGNIVFTTNPGGATPGSTTPGTQNLAVLPYAYANSNAVANGNLVTSLARYDAATGRIVPLNTATEYASNQTLANSTGAAGLNYRLAGAGNGGVAAMSGAVSLNGLVLDTNMAAPAPPVGVALIGNSTLNLTGPILSAFSGSGFPATIGAFLPNQIAVAGLNFGANTAYFHTPGDLWVNSPISGSGGLIKSGDANLYPLASNAFTGGLTINAGGVFFTADAQLGAAGGGILMNTGGSGGLFLTQMPFYDTTPAGSVTISRPLTIGAANGSMGSTLLGANLTYAGPITGTGGLVITTTGVTALTNSANNFVRDVVLRAGTTVVASDGALGNTANRVLMGGVGSAGILQPGPGFTSTNRDFILLPSTGTNTFFTNGVDLTINGVLSNTQSYGGGSPILKAGLGTLTLTAENTFSGGVTVGDTAGTGSRATSPNGTQYGGTLRLSGANGSLPLVSGYNVNNAAALTLENSVAVNNDRVGIVTVGLSGGSLNLIGNAGAAVTERLGAISTNDAGTITLTQPVSGGGQVTTLSATAFMTGGTFGGNLFVRGTNLGAANGDRTQLLVAPANLTTALPIANGIVVGGFAAASETATGPTDLMAATIVTPATAPNVARYSLAPLTTYGSLSAPGAAVNANQAGSTFALAGASDLNALRLGAGGGVNLGANTLTLGTATVNERAGTILAAGGANAGIANGTIDFGAQPARIVTTNNLTIGTAVSPTALLGTNTSASLVKSGPGTLTLFGSAATTLGANSTLTQSGSVTVTEGTLALGNATALGRATLNTGTVAPIPNMFGFMSLLKGATLDLSALSAAPVRINQILGGGNIALGDTTLNTGGSSSSLGGNITGSAASKFIVGISQAEIPFNNFGAGPALTGDNSGFFGQWQVLRGTLNFASNLSFGSGTSPILFSDTASNGSAGNPTLRIDASLTVPFPRDVQVPTGGFAVPVFLVGNNSNASMTGNLALGKAAAISGSPGASGIFTFAGAISGAGQLQLGSSVFSGSGSVAFAAANPGWSGGVLMNTGQNSSAISSIVAVGTDTSLGTGTLTLGQFAGLLRADNGARTLANAIDVTNTTPTAAFTTSFGSTGVNDLTLNGNVRSVIYQPFNAIPPSVPASPFTNTLNLNVINRGATTFAGTISNGAAFNFGVTKNGPGLVAINNNNSYTGDTVVNAGTVRLGNANALGFGGRQAVVNVAGAATVNSGAILDLNGQAGVNKPITLAGGSLLNNGASPASVAAGTVSSLTLGGTLTGFSAVPTLTLTGGGGSGATAVPSLGLAPASLSFTPLTQGGSGYSSPPAVAISGGSGATAQATLGVTSQTFTITNGGSGYPANATAAISSSGTSGATTATATPIVSGGVITGVTIVNPGTGYLFAPTITFSGTGGSGATGIGNATNFQVGSVVLTSPGGGFTSAPTVSFSGGGGTGTVVTTNATNFTLGVQVTNPGGGYTSAPSVSFGSGTATGTSNLSSVAVTASSNVGGSGTLTIDAPVSGAGGLVKVGPGTVVLTGANTYAGGTTVSAGGLRVSNVAGSGTGTGLVSVVGTGSAGSGGTLSGNGSIGGSVGISTAAVATRGGNLAPGDIIGTLTQTVGTMTWNPGGTYVFEHDVSAPNGDLMNGTGASNLDLSGLSTGSRFNLVLSPVTGFGNPSGTPLTYNLANYAGGVTPPVGIIGNDLTPYFNVTGGFVSVPTVTLAGTIVQVGFQPVPEPAHIVAAAAVVTLALAGWRRRRARFVAQQA